MNYAYIMTSNIQHVCVGIANEDNFIARVFGGVFCCLSTHAIQAPSRLCKCGKGVCCVRWLTGASYIYNSTAYSIKERKDVSILMHRRCQLQRYGNNMAWHVVNNAGGSNINMNII